MKILHIIASADPAGGGPIEGIIQQCLTSMGRGEREIVSLDAADAPFLRSFPLKIYPLGVRRYRKGVKSRLARFGYTPRLIAWLREHAQNYDIVVVNGLWNYASVGSSRVLPRLGIPYVVYPHGMMDPWFRSAYPIKHWLKQLFWAFFEGPLLYHARAALFTSEDEMIRARGQFAGHRYRERVVAYGTREAPDEPETQMREFRARMPSLGDHPYLLFLGRVHPKKGCDLLIRTFAAVTQEWPGLDLVIAGPDQIGWAKDLQSMAGALGVSQRIHWPGMLAGPVKWGALRGAEAFILPSHQENFGVAVAEALACGTPVLVTDKVSIWREIKADGAGLIETDDQEGIDRLVRSFLEMDQGSRARMRSAARKLFPSNTMT